MKEMIKKLFAPFEVVRYIRADGNEAIYKVVRFTKRPLSNKGLVVGVKAWKMANSGTDEGGGWRAFRFDRIQSRQLSF
ncbi:MAG: hypothetical protein ACO33Y_08840 [Burkholderiaceae bacterium]|jgi:hypothetical protein